MSLQRIFILPSNANNIAKIKHEIFQRMQTAGFSSLYASGESLSFVKSGTWSNIQGNLIVREREKDIEVIYNRNSNPLPLALVVGAASFFVTAIIGPIIVWFLYDQEGRETDDYTQNVMNTLPR